MKVGRYGNGNTDFSKLKVKSFPFHFFNKTDYASVGCGAAALGLLTGVNPETIKRKDNHYSDRFMVDFLRKHDLAVYEVNKANLTNRKAADYPLTDQHVILASLLLKKGEGSWFVWNNSYSFHNFSVTPVHFYEILNWVPISLYVIFPRKAI